MRHRALRFEFEALLRELPSAYPYQEVRDQALGGKIKFADAVILATLLRRYRPQTILEIGSFLGFSTRWFLEITLAWGATVTSLDPNIRHRIFDEPQKVLRKFNARFTNLEIVEAFFGECGDCIYNDYATYEPTISRERAREIVESRPVLNGDWPRKFDFIFIDGDHSEEAVQRDFRNARMLLNPGGCIILHDVLHWPGVEATLQRLRVEFGERALIKVYGKLEHALLKPLGKMTEGIGLFKLLAKPP